MYVILVTRLTKQSILLHKDKITYRYEVTSSEGTFDQAREWCKELGGDIIKMGLQKLVHGVSYEE